MNHNITLVFLKKIEIDLLFSDKMQLVESAIRFNKIVLS